MGKGKAHTKLAAVPRSQFRIRHGEQCEKPPATGLDLIDRVPEELWMEFVTLYRRQRSRPSPRKRNAKRQNV